MAAAQLKALPQGPAEIRRFDLEHKGREVRPGGKVLIVLSDDHAAPDEHTVAVNSGAFGGSHNVKETGPDNPNNPGCKCDDGSTVYATWVTVPERTPAGTYTVTATGHHGQQISRKLLAVAGDETKANSWQPWVFVGGAGAAVLAAGAWLALSRRSRRAATASE
ncbi:hypothetical protein ACIHFE_29915 [Streptomyces sp. NPDC052396]|uniref:hypothetical protein n=1 Tax=Streptomyces sp. NPDC052396 TaxID=3365689 RepID=UPI0037D8D03D